MTPSETKDLAFLRNPDNWPNWPMLPVVKRHRGTAPFDCGLFIHGLGCKVYNLNMFDLPKGVDTWQAAVQDVEYVEYSCPDDLISDWRVD